jgi:hypothetical protein
MQTKDKVVLSLSHDVRRQCVLRQQWWMQRKMMQLPLRISLSMQVRYRGCGDDDGLSPTRCMRIICVQQLGSVPCCRCGSLKHVTTSPSCKKLDNVSAYTADGRRKADGGRLQSLVNSTQDAARHSVASVVSIASVVSTASTASAEQGGSAPLRDATSTLNEQRPTPKTDLSGFPHLRGALKRFHDTWYVATRSLGHSRTPSVKVSVPRVSLSTPSEPPTNNRRLT